MSVRANWLRHPQNFSARKALFQVHLWTGIALGIYILVMSLTGCILIYRRSIATWASPQLRTLTITAQRMTVDQLKQTAQRAYPGYEVQGVFQSRNMSRPVEIVLTQGTNRTDRVFNPYTGMDMGPTTGPALKALNWIESLHDNLLLSAGAGHDLNAAGGIFLVLIVLTGIVIWWPGSRKWRRSLGIQVGAGLKKFNWSLHSFLGIWCVLFVFMWGFSGIYLSTPNLFNYIAYYFDPSDGMSRKMNLGDQFLYWLAQLHFGRFAGLSVEIIWTVFGLVPVALFVTGAFMWWNRVLSPWLKRSSHARAEMHPNNARQPQGSRGD
jgi:uncharacterized iron-regulated membrane protein